MEISKHLRCGSDLLVARKQDQSLPHIGEKYVEPNDSWLEEKMVKSSLQQVLTLLSEPLICRSDDLLKGEWINDFHLVKLAQRGGKFPEFMGVETNIGFCLYPEEAMYLMQNATLEVTFEGIAMSLQHAMNLFFDDSNQMDQYLVYCHMSRLGNKVVRHQKDLNITKYEKQIRLDQHQQKRLKVKIQLNSISKEFIEKKDEEFNQEFGNVQREFGRIEDVPKEEDTVKSNDLQEISTELELENKLDEMIDMQMDNSQPAINIYCVNKCTQDVNLIKDLVTNKELIETNDIIQEIKKELVLENKLNDSISTKVDHVDAAIVVCCNQRTEDVELNDDLDLKKEFVKTNDLQNINKELKFENSLEEIIDMKIDTAVNVGSNEPETIISNVSELMQIVVDNRHLKRNAVDSNLHNFDMTFKGKRNKQSTKDRLLMVLESLPNAARNSLHDLIEVRVADSQFMPNNCVPSKRVYKLSRSRLEYFSKYDDCSNRNWRSPMGKDFVAPINPGRVSVKDRLDFRSRSNSNFVGRGIRKTMKLGRHEENVDKQILSQEPSYNFKTGILGGCKFPKLTLNEVIDDTPYWKIGKVRSSNRDNALKKPRFPSCLMQVPKSVKSWQDYKSCVDGMISGNKMKLVGEKDLSNILWGPGRTHPLLDPSTSSAKEVTKLCQLSNKFETKTKMNKIVLHFDIYSPMTRYRKSVPSLPDLRVAVISDEKMVSTGQMLEISNRFSDEVSVAFAVVVAGQVRLYSLTPADVIPLDLTHGDGEKCDITNV